MKKLSVKKNVSIVLAVVILLIVAIAVFLSVDVNHAFAETDYSASYTNVSDEQLDLLTNRDTVNYDAPQITVFVHGLGSHAFHWSNDGHNHFAYQQSSMPEQLRQSIGKNNAVMYGIKVAYDMTIYSGENNTQNGAQSVPVNLNSEGQVHDGAAQFQGIYATDDYKANSGGIMLYDCNKSNGSRYLYPNILVNSDLRSIKQEDTQKHIILIFEQFTELEDGNTYYHQESNDFVYSQLEYCLDAISYQYRQLTGDLPTYNLVSHSRGGITIMQYALGHPYNVASLYTVGAPFDGSKLGRVKVGGDNILLGVAGYEKDYKYADGTANYAPGILDLVENTTTLSSYSAFWNEHYGEYYSHIDFTPIGSYATLGCIFQVVAEAGSTMLLKLDTNTEFGANVDSTLRAFALIFEGFSQIPSLVSGHFADELSTLLNVFWDMLKSSTKGTDEYSIVDALSLFDCATPTEYSHIGWRNSDFEFVFLDDLFLHLDSQIANGYAGRNVKVRCFNSITQMIGEKNVNDVGVIHNLEIHDREIVNYVVRSLRKGDAAEYNVRYTEDGCVIMSYAGTPFAGTVTIPSEYNGSKVIGIDGFSASVDMADKTVNHADVTKIIIPSTVKTIGDYAFVGMKNLKEIVFTGENNIEEIGEYAFANCTSLKSFSLGNKTTNIDETAFLYSGITNFVTNDYYTWNGSLLINTNVTDATNKIAVYVNPYVTTLTIPNDVKTLGAYLFAGNQRITTIDFNQVQYIGVGAFIGSSAVNFKNTDNIVDADISAFIGSRWLKSQTSDYIRIGKVLIQYKGDSEQITIPEGIERIGENAIYGEQIHSAILPSTLATIGQETFKNCENLQWVLMQSVMPPVLDGDCFNSDVTIYVKQTSLKYYLNSIYYQDLKNRIAAKNVTVTFRSKDGSFLGTKQETYYSTFDQYITAPEITGYDFVCWLDDYGREVYVNDLFTYYNDVDLTAYYEKSKYTITLNNGNSSNTLIIEYGQTVKLDIPSKKGYTFLGWYDKAKGGNKIIDATGKCVWQRTNEVEALYMHSLLP